MDRAVMVMLKCLSVDGERTGSGGCRFGMGMGMAEELGRVERRLRTCLE